jgi:hypothetical protein
MPHYCHEDFYYTINQASRFEAQQTPPTPSIDPRVTNVPIEVLQSIALYLRTMRVGIGLANEIENKLYSTGNEDCMIHPTSLCCRELTIGKRVVSNAKLIASPIPGAVNRADIKIHQGELFEVSTFDGLPYLIGREDWYTFADQITGPVLIKMNHVAVHDHLVKPAEALKAISKIFNSQETNLKMELSRVLVAFGMESPSTCFSVMTDLRKHATLPFCDLAPVALQGKTQALWLAFSKLVRTVLLPMAKCGVVHADIRAGWERTYNILFREIKNEVELCLIDYESFVTYKVSTAPHGRAISIEYFGDKETTAFEFLWWQVMLMAYVWNSQMEDDKFKQYCCFADEFVNTFFTNEDMHSIFKGFFVDHKWERLKELSQNCHQKEDVEELLGTLSVAFIKDI